MLIPFIGQKAKGHSPTFSESFLRCGHSLPSRSNLSFSRERLFPVKVTVKNIFDLMTDQLEDVTVLKRSDLTLGTWATVP